MSDLTLAELERGDRISIDSEPLAGPLWRVSDTEVEDLGLMEIPLVTIVSDSEGWLLHRGDEWEVVATDSLKESGETHRFAMTALEVQS
jgi:hypothetical protein